MKAFILDLKCAKMKHTTIQSEGYTSSLIIFPQNQEVPQLLLFKRISKSISHSLKQCAKKFCITAHRSDTQYQGHKPEAQSNLLYIYGYVHEAYEICSLLEVTDEVITVHVAGSISGPLEFRQFPQQLLMSAFESFLLLQLPSLLVVQLIQVFCGVGQNSHFRSLGCL